MPGYAVSALSSMLESIAGSMVVVLGAAYRGGVKETAFSGVFPLVRRLAEGGAAVGVHDPLYTDASCVHWGSSRSISASDAMRRSCRPTSAIDRTIGPIDLPGAKAIVDGRRVLSAGEFAAVGVPVRVLGGLGGSAHRRYDRRLRSGSVALDLFVPHVARTR